MTGSEANGKANPPPFTGSQSAQGLNPFSSELQSVGTYPPPDEGGRYRRVRFGATRAALSFPDPSTLRGQDDSSHRRLIVRQKQEP